MTEKPDWRVRLEYQIEHARDNCDWQVESDLKEALKHIDELERKLSEVHE